MAEKGYFGKTIDPLPNSAYSVTKGEPSDIEKKLAEIAADDEQDDKAVEALRLAITDVVKMARQALERTMTPGAPGKDGKDGKDGRTPTNAELIALITPLIPAPEKGERGEKGLKGDKGDKGDTGAPGKDADMSKLADIEKRLALLELNVKIKK